jgi:amino acid transporter
LSSGDKIDDSTDDLILVAHDRIDIGLNAKKRMTRTISFAEAVSIGLGGTIGGGVFSVLGVVAGFAGPAAILSFLLGGIFSVFLGYSYTKLSLKYPSAGGSFSFCEVAFGKKIGGFFGWLLTLGYLMSCSLYAYTFGSYFAELILPEDPAWWLMKLLQCIFSVVLIAAAAVVNLIGTKETGLSQLIFVGIKLLILVIFIGVTIYPAITNASENLVPFFPEDSGALDNFFIAFSLIMVGLSNLFVAFQGLELIPNTSEEIVRPKKNIPRSIYGTIIITTIIYLFVSFCTLAGTNYTNFTGENADKAEFALAIAAEPILGYAGIILISLGALFSTASAFNASLYGSSRVVYVMARENVFISIFKKLSRKARVPFISILTISGLTAVLTVSLNLQQIAQLAGLIFISMFAAVSLASFLLRKEINANWVMPMIGFVLSVVGLGINIWYQISQYIEEGSFQNLLPLILFPVVILLAFLGSFLSIKYNQEQEKTIEVTPDSGKVQEAKPETKMKEI